MDFIFESDAVKASRNFRKHGVRFSEAETVFYDEHALEMFDAQHSQSEDRYVRIGLSGGGRVLIVVFSVRTAQGHHVRLISARPASRRENAQYFNRWHTR